MTGAIDAGGLYQVARHLLETGSHPHDAERDVQTNQRQDQRKTGVKNAHITDFVVQRRHHRFERNGQADKEQGIDEAFARYFQLCERISAKRAEDHHARHHHDHQNAAVEQ